MPRTGVIGEQIFEQVEKLVKGGMSRTDAFKRISADSGRREGTVAANYYRVARKRAGGSLRPRRGGRARATATRGRRATTTRASGNGDIDALTRSLVQNVQDLAAAMNAQAAEVKDLRSRLEGVRKLLG
jgi:hypothetical protein